MTARSLADRVRGTRIWMCSSSIRMYAVIESSMVGSRKRSTHEPPGTVGLPAARLLARFNPGDDPGRRDAQRAAQSEQHVHGRGLLVPFELGDVRPIDAGPEGELFLAQAGLEPGPPQFRAEGHGGTLPACAPPIP